MRKNIVITITAVGFVLLATSVNASFYIGVNGGISMTPDSDVKFSHSDVGGNSKGTLSWDSGYLVSAIVGYGWNDLPIRIEGEAFYQENDMDTLEIGGTKPEADDGNSGFENTGFLVNGYYDFANSSNFIPYISAGMGYSKIEMSGDDPLKAGRDANGVQTVDDSGLAWQVGAGVAYKISAQFIIDLKYRYYQSAGFTFTNQDTGTIDKAVTDFDYSVHNILFGVRYTF